MRKHIKKILLCLLVVIALVLVFLWLRARSPQTTTAPYSNSTSQAAPGHAHETQVSLAPIQQQRIAQTVSAYGQTISTSSMALAAPEAGVITALHVKPGELVRQGQLLVSIRLSDGSMQLAKLHADMLQLQAHYQRMQQANKQVPGSIARDDVDQAKSAFTQAQSTYQAALAASELRAAVAGRVSASSLTVGSTLAAGQIIFQIITGSDVQVAYTLPSQYADQAKLGQAVRFVTDSAPAKSYVGSVSYVAPQLNSSGDQFSLRARLNAAKNLQPNRFGKLTQVLNTGVSSLVIPQALVQTDARGFYVYTVQMGKVAKLYFQPGITTPQGMIVVQHGIAAGSQMIVSDTSQLVAGQQVQIVAPAAARPATPSN